MERQEQEELITVEQIKRSFDDFITKIDENNNINLIKQVVEFLIHSNEKLLCESSLIGHRIFVILRDYYLNLFQRWYSGEKLDEISSFIFESISNIFLKLSNHISDNNALILKDLIFNEILFNEINKFLEEFSINFKYCDDYQIKNLDNFFRTIERLERYNFDNKKDYFFDNIVKCICSSSFIQIFLQSVKDENDNPGEKFLLKTCTDYISSHSIDKQHQQSLINIQKSILQPFTQWLNQHSALFRLWNNKIIIIIRQITFLLTLNIQLNRLINLDKDTFDSYSQIIDSFINILYSITQSDNYFIHNKLIGTIIPNLYTMTLSNQLEKYIQNKHITLLILKLTTFPNDEIQLNAFQILSTVTMESDTKNIQYSNSITNIFLKNLNDIIDDSNQTLTFYNLLRCFKSKFSFSF